MGYDRNMSSEQEIYKPLKQISVGRLESSKKSTQINKDKNLEHKNTVKVNTSEVPKEPTSPKVKRMNTYAEVVKKSKIINTTETKVEIDKTLNGNKKSENM